MFSAFAEEPYEGVVVIRFRAEVYTREQLKSVLSDGRIDAVYAPLDLIDGDFSGEADRIIIVPPVYLADCEESVRGRLERLKKLGFRKALAHTVGHMELLRGLDIEVHGGVRLNCTNSEALLFFSERGAVDALVSAELSAREICRLKKPFEIGFVAYGHLPLMITRRCPINNGKPCGGENCGKTLTDRTGRRLRVICTRNTAEILNSEPLDVGDRLGDFENADFAVLKFTVETETEPIISAFCEGRRTDSSSFTRGLYFSKKTERKQNEH